MLGTTPSSMMTLLIQTAFVAIFDVAMLLTSTVELTTMLCFELFQLTAPSFK
jgi:hypothetical protein